MRERHCKLAVNMAYKSTSRFRLGAVLAKKNRVLSTGFNDMRRTHPKMEKFNTNKTFTLGLHAEIHSCLGVPMADLEGSDLYVARILKDNTLAMAKPCAVCTKFILDVGINQVYFSFNNKNWESWCTY